MGLLHQTFLKFGFHITAMTYLSIAHLFAPTQLLMDLLKEQHQLNTQETQILSSFHVRVLLYETTLRCAVFKQERN